MNKIILFDFIFLFKGEAIIFLRYKKSHKKKLYCANKFLFIILVIILAIVLFLGLDLLLVINNKFMDKIITQSKFIINNQINLVLNNSINELVKKNNLTTDDFYNINLDNGHVNFLSANTILINKFCTQLAIDLSNKFLDLKTCEIKFPVGALISSILRINFFNTSGPNIKIYLIPIGNALVNYETRFNTAGINQTNFQIWLNIKFDSQIINPLYKKKFVFKKNIVLVNTIINGTVPETYFDYKKIGHKKFDFKK